METLLGLVVGVGLSAAAGFRVFVPLLLIGLGSRLGYFRAPDALLWAASPPALIALGMATAVEVFGYLVPWVDHVLDLLALPAACLAGVFLTYALVPGAPPYLHWGLAIIAGGTVAGGTRTAMATTRAASTATTGGLANPLVGLLELALSVVSAILSILVPLFALGAGLVAVPLVLLWARRRRHRAAVSQPPGKRGQEPIL